MSPSNRPTMPAGGAPGAGQPGRPEPTDSAAQASAPRPRKRSWMLRVLLGLLAFFVGALLAAFFLAPVLLGRFAPGWIEGLAADELDGSVDVKKLQIAWTGRQELGMSLFDPAGQSIGDFDFDLAPLSQWLRSGGQAWGENRVRFGLNLVVDEQGRLNLRDALQPAWGGDEAPDESSGESSGESQGHDSGQSPGERPDRDSQRPEVEVHGRSELPEQLLLLLEPSEVTFNDRSAGGLGEVRLTEVVGRIEIDATQGLRVELRGQSFAPNPGRFELTMTQRPQGAGAGESGHSGKTKQVELSISAQGLPTNLIEALAGSAGLLTEALGAQLGLEVKFSGEIDGELSDEPQTWRTGHLSWDLSGPRGHSQQAVSLSSNGLSLDSGGSHRSAGAAALLAAYFEAQNAKGQAQGPKPSWLVQAEEGDLALEVQRFSLPAEALKTENIDWAEVLRATEISLQLRSPDLRCERGAGPNGAGQSGTGQAGTGQGKAVKPQLLLLQGLTLDLRALPGQAPELLIAGRAADAAGASGGLSGSVGFGDLQALWKGVSERQVPVGPVAFKVEQAPAGLVDGLLASSGLLRDVLGERFDLTLKAPSLIVPLDQPLEALGSLEVTLESPRCSAQMAGQLRNGNFATAAAPAAPGRARFALNELASQRLASGLMPLLAGVRSHSPEDRAVLEFEGLNLPLNGDLSQLSGQLRLDLGQVDGGLLGPLAQLWPTAARFENQRFQPLELSINNGRISYQGWSLDIGGTALPLSGEYNLLNGELLLDARLPLAAIGGDLGRTLEQARGFLPADTAIPLRLSGQPKSLSLSLAPAAGAIVAEAARKALEAQALEVLGGKLPALPEGLEGVIDPSKLPPGLGGLLEQLKKKKSGG